LTLLSCNGCPLINDISTLVNLTELRYYGCHIITDLSTLPKLINANNVNSN
jgi:hypothetical protein